jgi:hypothetical protein
MIGKRVDVKPPYADYVIKVMYVGRCADPGCKKWFEYMGGNAILWP